jgi:hypothetical protein
MSSMKSESNFARVGFSLSLKKVDPSNLTSPMTGISNSNKLEQIQIQDADTMFEVNIRPVLVGLRFPV